MPPFRGKITNLGQYIVILTVCLCVFCLYLYNKTAANELSMSDSPLESDRTELLRVADPVDYSGHATADFYFADLANTQGTETEYSHHTASTSRPRSLPVDRQWPTQPTGRPPKNIFDDI